MSESIHLSPFENKDELIHELIQDLFMSLVNQFLNQFGYDLNQDLHQEMLTFIDIHIQINSWIDYQDGNRHMNWLKNKSLVKF